MNKKYIVTVREVSEITSIERGDYTVIDKRPWTEGELANAGFGRSDAPFFLKESPLKEIRGYAPDRETVKTVETELLRQTVETLDLTAVIMAVNGL